MINKLRSREISVRPMKIVLDLEDIFKPPTLLEDYINMFGSDPTSPKFRVVEIEVLTCPEDEQPITISECGKCPKFVRKFNESILCKSYMAIYR